MTGDSDKKKKGKVRKPVKTDSSEKSEKLKKPEIKEVEVTKEKTVADETQKRELKGIDASHSATLFSLLDRVNDIDFSLKEIEGDIEITFKCKTTYPNLEDLELFKEVFNVQAKQIDLFTDKQYLMGKIIISQEDLSGRIKNLIYTESKPMYYNTNITVYTAIWLCIIGIGSIAFANLLSGLAYSLVVTPIWYLITLRYEKKREAEYGENRSLFTEEELLSKKK